jgi:hypothetical protein
MSAQPSKTHLWALFKSARGSTHPLYTSVAVSVRLYSPES